MNQKCVCVNMRSIQEEPLIPPIYSYTCGCYDTDKIAYKYFSCPQELSGIVC